MKLDKIFSQVRDAIYGGAGANLSIGNPSQLGDVSVIPVARVVFSFGGGGGKSPAKARQNSKSKPAEDASQKSEPEEKMLQRRWWRSRKNRTGRDLYPE